MYCERFVVNLVTHSDLSPTPALFHSFIICFSPHLVQFRCAPTGIWICSRFLSTEEFFSALSFTLFVPRSCKKCFETNIS